MIVRMVADGTTSDELLEEYPQLTADDIREALRFAATHVDQRTIALDHSTCAFRRRWPSGIGWLTTSDKQADALGHLAKVHGMNTELRCSPKQLQGVTDVVEEHLVPAERRGQAAPGQAIRP
jgi:hypothetical protein